MGSGVTCGGCPVMAGSCNPELRSVDSFLNLRLTKGGWEVVCWEESIEALTCSCSISC